MAIHTEVTQQACCESVTSAYGVCHFHFRRQGLEGKALRENRAAFTATCDGNNLCTFFQKSFCCFNKVGGTRYPFHIFIGNFQNIQHRNHAVEARQMFLAIFDLRRADIRIHHDHLRFRGFLHQRFISAA